MSSRLNVTIPQFSGLSTSPVTRHQFLTDFENFSALCNISGDSKLVATFQLHLTDEARWWFDDLPSDLRSSWAKVKDAFQLRFVQRNSANTSDFIHQENLFLQMQLAPCQSINSFFLFHQRKSRNSRKVAVRFIGQICCWSASALDIFCPGRSSIFSGGSSLSRKER
ncbi:hypothetical protein PoB_005777800 [Plakobranchus ocellatus]|uniref:Retrotransposon gag domain-containing protein n=1 Tax=Plakobranchus ocellatus TaxID=259542 RepID=A0AAV4CJK8_9GAST|nr:hypothetical protein PoB_005777800 [Plakobranchus ocellatus]